MCLINLSMWKKTKKKECGRYRGKKQNEINHNLKINSNKFKKIKKKSITIPNKKKEN